MTKTELLASLNNSQRKEFETDIQAAITSIMKKNTLYPDELHVTDINLRLQGEVFLNVTLEFKVHNGQCSGQVKDIVRFTNIDQYLDSINTSKCKGSDGIRIK